MGQKMTAKDSREEANTLADEIYDWAEKGVGDISAGSLMMHIRGLARLAVKAKGRGSHPYETYEEAKNVRTAAQDFMELFDSIRCRAEHKEER